MPYICMIEGEKACLRRSEISYLGDRDFMKVVSERISFLPERVKTLRGANSKRSSGNREFEDDATGCRYGIRCRRRQRRQSRVVSFRAILWDLAPASLSRRLELSCQNRGTSVFHSMKTIPTA